MPGHRPIRQMDQQTLVSAIGDMNDARLKGVLDALQLGILIEDEHREPSQLLCSMRFHRHLRKID